MNANFNKIMLMGNVTQDLELRATASGVPVCNFDIAVNQMGAKDQEPLYMRVVTFRSQAENCARYLKKGRPVFVEGRVQISSWTDDTGLTRKKPEVVARMVKFLGERPAPEDIIV